MERKVEVTADGSSTIHIPEMGVTYHSKHGAIQESLHVFIHAGLSFYCGQHPEKRSIHIFEMGFGTGLNALLTSQYAEQHNITIQYEAVELHPLNEAEVNALNYDSALLQQLHSAAWSATTAINAHLLLTKHSTSLQQFVATEQFDVIYYDAFAPGAQPELWTEEIFRKLYNMLTLNGVLVTYCSKSDVRRAMIAAGFSMEKIPGPPGKREILRGTIR